MPTGKDVDKLAQEDDSEIQKAREKEVGEVFGREELPRLERLDYEVRS